MCTKYLHISIYFPFSLAQFIATHIMIFTDQVHLSFLVYSILSAYLLLALSIILLWILCSHSFISFYHLQQTNPKQYTSLLVALILLYLNGLAGFVILLTYLSQLPALSSYMSVACAFYLAYPIAFFSLRTLLFLSDIFGELLHYQCFNHFRNHQFIDCSVTLLFLVSFSLALPVTVMPNAFDDYNIEFSLWLMYSALLLLILLIIVWSNLYFDKWQHASINRDNCFRVEAAFFTFLRIIALQGAIHGIVRLQDAPQMFQSTTLKTMWSANLSALIFLTPMFVYLPFKRLLLRMQPVAQTLQERIFSEYYQYFAFSIFLMFYIFLQLLITLPNMDFELVPFALSTLIMVLIINLIINLSFLFVMCCCLKRILQPGEFQTQKNIIRLQLFLLIPVLFCIIFTMLMIFVFYEYHNNVSAQSLQFSLTFNDPISSYLLVYLAAQIYQVPYMMISFQYLAIQNGAQYQIYTEMFEEIEEQQSEVFNSGIMSEDMNKFLDATILRSDSKVDACAICLGDLHSATKKLIRLKKCKHTFHQDCIHGWLKEKGTCPLDRTRLKENKE